MHEQRIPRALPLAHSCLGRALRDLRTACGLTHRDVGARVGVHQVYVAAIERGSIDPTFWMLIRFTRALNSDVSSLVERYSQHAEAWPAEPGAAA